MRAMKKLQTFLMVCAVVCSSNNLRAQIFSVASGTELNVMPGTIFSADSLIFTPISKFTLTGVILNLNSVVTNPTNLAFIKKDYKFSNTTNPFSGSVQINYADGQLTGLPKSDLKLMAFTGNSWQLYPDSTNNTSTDNVLSKAIKSVTLNELTLGTCIPPAAPSAGSTTICSGSNAILSGSGVGTLGWYDSATGGKWLGRGSTFNTPTLANTTIYYLQDSTCAASLTRTAVTVTVNALPVVTSGSSVCVGSTITLSPTSGGNWTSSNTAVATVTNAGVVTGVSSGTATFTFTSTTTGCSNTTSSVTVNALPAITGTLSVCAGSTTQLTGSGTAATTTPWVSGTTTVATVSSTGLVTGVAAGTSIITYTNSSGCTTTTTITVISLPTITGTIIVCAGSTTQLTGSGTAAYTTPWVSGTTTVATVSSTGLVTGVAAGTSVITFTNSGGCKTTATVTVNALSSITGTLTTCVGSKTQLAGSGTAASTTPWVSGTTTVATVNSTGLVMGVGAGTSVITYTNSGGCKITATVTISATPTITGTLTVCAGSTTQLIGSGTAATTAPWVSGTTTVATVSGTGLVTGVAAGTSVITFTNSGGCKTTSTVTVYALPTAPAAIGGTKSVCVGSTTALTETTTGGTWSSSTPTLAIVSTSGLVTGVAAGTATIVYITAANANGCKNSTSSAVTVNALPTITGTLTVCVGSTTQLTGSGTAAATSPWVSATTTVATVSTTGLVTGVAAGTSVITFTNNSGCKITATVTVSALPTITGTLTVCAGSTTQLTGSGTAATTTPWISGTTTVATVSSTGLVTGVTAGTSVITYTASTGCAKTATVPVSAAPAAPVTSAATTITATGFTAKWTASTGATGYYLDVSTVSTFASFVTGYNNKNVGNVVTSAVTGLTTSTTYYYRIRAFNANCTSVSSATISLTTLASIPAAPVAAAATSVTSTGFTANWTASSGATGYYLDVSTSSKFANFVTGYNNKSAGNVVTSAVTGLTANTTYYYRIRAFNTAGTSGNSSTITVKTAPVAPVATAGTAIAQTTFSANWGASTGATGYYLDVSTVNTFASILTGYNNKSVGNVVTSSVTGLTASTTYYYRVRAFNTGGTSGNSNTITVTSLKSAAIPIDSLQGSVNNPIQVIDIPTSKNELNVYPNPTFGSATFTFQINQNAKVKLDIYSVNGLLIARVFDGDAEAGIAQSVKFDQSLSTGIYPCVLRWNQKMITVKLVIIQ